MKPGEASQRTGFTEIIFVHSCMVSGISKVKERAQDEKGLK